MLTPSFIAVTMNVRCISDCSRLETKDCHLDSRLHTSCISTARFANSRIDVWIYGHSHTNIDTTIGNTKIVCNQMRDVFSNEHLTNGFESGKVIKIITDR